MVSSSTIAIKRDLSAFSRIYSLVNRGSTLLFNTAQNDSQLLTEKKLDQREERTLTAIRRNEFRFKVLAHCVATVDVIMSFMVVDYERRQGIDKLILELKS